MQEGKENTLLSQKAPTSSPTMQRQVCTFCVRKKSPLPSLRLRVKGNVQLQTYAELVCESCPLDTPALCSVQKPEANSKPAASKEVLKTPLVQQKPLKQDDSAFSILLDNPCTGVTLVTPMDQQLAMQRSVRL